MEKVLLKTIAKQIRGVSYKPNELGKENIDGFIPLLRAGNIGTSAVSNLNDLVFVSKKNVGTQQYLQEGDILIAASSGSIDIVGKSTYIEQSKDFTFGAFCKVIRPNKDLVNPKYVSYYFQTDYYRKKISNLAQGANINNIKNEHIDNLAIPLPNIESQNKIVALLDKIKVVLNIRQETISKYDELLRAIFLDTFGNPMERPNQWKLDTIEKSLINLSSGTSYSGDENKLLEEDEFGVLKVSAVTRGFFNANEFKAVKKDVIKRQTIHPKKGDLLFSRANTLELVGATCIVDADYDNLFLPDKIWKVETDESIIKKTYLHYVLQNKDVRKTFLSIATGSSGSMLNISMDKFRNIIIPYPPIELQKQFEKTYLKHTRLKEILKKSHQHISELFGSISQLAFKGELNFNTAVDLEMLLENDYTFFKENSNQETIKLLLKRLGKDELSDNKFYDQRLYDKAKEFVFELLKEHKIKQVFDDRSKRVKLTT